MLLKDTDMNLRMGEPLALGRGQGWWERRVLSRLEQEADSAADFFGLATRRRLWGRRLLKWRLARSRAVRLPPVPGGVFHRWGALSAAGGRISSFSGRRRCGFRAGQVEGAGHGLRAAAARRKPHHAPDIVAGGGEALSCPPTRTSRHQLPPCSGSEPLRAAGDGEGARGEGESGRLPDAASSRVPRIRWSIPTAPGCSGGRWADGTAVWSGSPRAGTEYSTRISPGPRRGFSRFCRNCE